MICVQVATQLLNLPERRDAQFDKLLAITINYLLLAQGAADVDTRLYSEDVLQNVVEGVSASSRSRLIEVFLKASKLRFSRSRCVAL
jgi:hypothetical protein